MVHSLIALRTEEMILLISMYKMNIIISVQNVNLFVFTPSLRHNMNFKIIKAETTLA